MWVEVEKALSWYFWKCCMAAWSEQELAYAIEAGAERDESDHYGKRVFCKRMCGCFEG